MTRQLQKSESQKEVASIPVLILAGGRGERLGRLCDTCPKPMLPVADRPFLDHLVCYLHRQGVRRFVFLTGHLGNRVQEYFVEHAPEGCDMEFLLEDRPLGTGGAIARAVSVLRLNERFLVMNGDSFTPFAVTDLYHAAQSGDGGILAVETEDASRFGTLQVDARRFLTGFEEKSECVRSGLINAGIYCLDPSLFACELPHAPLSVEKDLFPRWLRAGRRFGVVSGSGAFLDIGTPESLAQAAEFVMRLCSREEIEGNDAES